MKNLKMLTLVIATLVSTASFAGTKQYSLKGDIVVGSSIRPTIAISSIPFHKNYYSLTDQQKELFNSKFELLGVSDTPPFPKNGLKDIYRPILKQNIQLNSHESFSYTAKIDENGNVISIQQNGSTKAQVPQFVVESLSNVQFDPALCSGVACSMDFPIEFVL